MYRVKKRAPGLNWGRWESFGERLEWWRSRTSLTQERAGKAVGVSRRQWIRYTKGAPVPFNRLWRISKSLGVRYSQVLLHAGYEPKKPDVDVKASLRHIRDSVFERNLVGALVSLYNFYQETHKDVRLYRTQPELMMIKNFILAVEAMNGLPSWLRRDLVEYLFGLEYGGDSQDFLFEPAIRKRVRAKIAEKIRNLAPTPKRPA